MKWETSHVHTAEIGKLFSLQQLLPLYDCFLFPVILIKNFLYRSIPEVHLKLKCFARVTVTSIW